MNYQEALDKLYNDYNKDYQKAILQELINNYSKLKSEIIAVEEVSDSRWEEVKRYEKVIDNLNEYISKLEKALDKAVDVISSIKGISIKGLGDTNYSWNESVKVALFSEETTFEINNEESEKQ